MDDEHRARLRPGDVHLPKCPKGDCTPRRLGSTEILMTAQEKAGRARHQEQVYKIVHEDVAEFGERTLCGDYAGEA